ncbi:MAG: globin domain-containing protein [Pseudomonadota bacterium]|nr:globin domain-containing protein [Pseudomonadota bacterium]MEE3101005.1 globin domain-containing protein [Pseudomonadota bacterium]
MELDPDEISEIRSGWFDVSRSREMAIGLFYGRLFQIAPRAQALFGPDMAAQGRKLAEMLDQIIRKLERPDQLSLDAAELARRHARYGVRPEHYDQVGAALIWMLGRVLGDGFSPAQRAAWAHAYSALSAEMIAAAYPDRPASGPVAAEGRAPGPASPLRVGLGGGENPRAGGEIGAADTKP